jgi:IS30 family transposase
MRGKKRRRLVFAEINPRRHRRRELKRQFWIAIASGLTSREAALRTGCGADWFAKCGGMRPMSLTPLSGHFLSFEEREEIAVLRAQQFGVREIARRVRRDPSTVSRELRRNVATRGNRRIYRASTAQLKAELRAKRPKPSKLAVNEALCDYVQKRLAGAIAMPDGSRAPGQAISWQRSRRHAATRRDRPWANSWSPEQIANRLKIDFPDTESMRVSHEAIYQALYVQGRGALRRELAACLRTGRALRVPRAHTRRPGKKLSADVMISERPAEADDRAVPGHWEGDLIVGGGRAGKTAIGTLVERTSRFTILLHLPRLTAAPSTWTGPKPPPMAGRGAEAVRNAIASSIQTLPKQLRRSLTWDQGSEMGQYARLRIDTGLAIYFCDPHSPWQRGTNENTNGLLRQYFPKGTDLSRHSKGELDAVAAALNGRPRKTLNWRTPAEVLNDLLRKQQSKSVAKIP